LLFLLLVKVKRGKNIGSIGVERDKENKGEKEVKEKEEEKRVFFFSFFA